MSSSCDALLAALKTCLLESDCVQRHGRLPSECLKQHADELPETCQNLRKAAFECKRNMASCFIPHVKTTLMIAIAGYEEEIPGKRGGHGRRKAEERADKELATLRLVDRALSPAQQSWSGSGSEAIFQRIAVSKPFLLYIARSPSCWRSLWTQHARMQESTCDTYARYDV